MTVIADRAPIGLGLRLALGLLCAALAAACSTRPVPDERFTARRALAEAAERGPVLAVVRGRPFDLAVEERDALVLGALEDGIRALDVEFTTDPASAAGRVPRLVVVMNPTGPASGGLACRDPGAIPTAPAGGSLKLLAAFCDGDTPLGVTRDEAAVSGPDDRALRRLLWRAGGDLFPDDYASTYGLRLLPPWLGVSVGGTFGF